MADLDLLILDAWGLEPINAAIRIGLLTVMGGRYEKTSPIMISKLPSGQCYQAIDANTLAEAIHDRLMHNAHGNILTDELGFRCSN